jgi:hypothetical protein
MASNPFDDTPAGPSSDFVDPFGADAGKGHAGTALKLNTPFNPFAMEALPGDLLAIMLLHASSLLKKTRWDERTC